jgi:mRNA-degrading endonuclease RelE of RelBE toxin-antitoxin system
LSWTYQIHEDADADLDALGPAARAEITAWLEKRIQGSTNPELFGKPLRGAKHVSGATG